MITIHNNREKLVANHKKGKLYRWRKNYPNSKQLFKNSKIVEKNEDSKGNESTETTEDQVEADKSKFFVPDFFKEGGLVFIDDPFDVNYLNAKSLSVPLIKGLYENVRKHNIQDLTLDDIADATRNTNMI